MTILPIVGMVSGLAGAGLSAYSTYQQGKAEQAMANRNADIADAAAKNESLAAAENSKRIREDNHRQLATIRANMAGSGVSGSSGSFLDTIGQTASQLELRTMDMFRDSEAKQVQYGNDADITRWQGAQAMQAAKLKAIGSLIGGVSSMAGNMSSMGQMGILRTGTA